MNNFLSCDWGTSSFRLKYVDVEKQQIIAEVNTEVGISATYNFWVSAGQIEANRPSFYFNILHEYIKNIEEDIGYPLNGVPLILSGMASSSIGLKEVSYRQLPFRTDGSDIKTAFFQATEKFDHDVLLISGVKADNDVMRGEETQLIGCFESRPEKAVDELYIFPGTHSKHIRVKEDHVVCFRTYMTGEFFHVLSQHSILNSGLEKNNDIEDLHQQNSFKDGVQDALRSNFLNSAFRVRTNELFNKVGRSQSYNYLSGLLIGTELKDLLSEKKSRLFLCCGSNLRSRYKIAIEALDLHQNTHVFSAKWSDEAVLRGHFKIYNQHFKAL